MRHTKRKCIIHIGAPKTGSTALQKFLFDNRKSLCETGVLYPNVSLRGFGHHDLAFLTGGGYPDWAVPQERPLKDLAADLAKEIQRGYKTILLSSEDFYLFSNPTELMALLEQSGINSGFEKKIIIYIRRQDIALESWYNQKIKAQGYTGTFNECLTEDADIWDYDYKLTLWEKVFGCQNLVIKPYQNGALLDNDICKDFLNFLGLDFSVFAFLEERINTGLNKDILEFQRIINTLNLPVKEKRKYHRELIELTAKSAGKGIFDESTLLLPQKRLEIIDRYQLGNSRVAKKYFNRKKLFEDGNANERNNVVENDGLTRAKKDLIINWLTSRSDSSKPDVILEMVMGRFQ